MSLEKYLFLNACWEFNYFSFNWSSWLIHLVLINFLYA